MEGSAIRRIGYERWLRNIAVGLGNADLRRGDRRGAERRAETILRRWCASMSPGRWRGRPAQRAAGSRRGLLEPLSRHET